MAKDLPRSTQVPEAIGFEFAAYDGGLQPFRYWTDSPIRGVHCPGCHGPIDLEAVSSRVSVRGKSDVFYADGHIIVTERFRDFCIQAGYHDVEFLLIDKRRPLFELRPTRILDIDIECSQPLLRSFCLRCGNFDCYLEGRATILRDTIKPLEDGFYRTDLVFGCSIGKHPKIIVAAATRKKIEAEGFRRLSFTPIPTIDPDFERRRVGSLDSELREMRRLRGKQSWRPKSWIRG
jgi:hypothetical protein